MQELELTLEAHSPVYIGNDLTRHGLNVLQGLDYIPGSTIRGAIAYYYGLPRNIAEEDTFLDIFCSDKLQFGFQYINEGKIGVRSQPIPLSARTSKHYPGFKDDPTEELQGNGVWDALLHPSQVVAVSDSLLGFEGYYYTDEASGSIGKTQVRMRISPHNRINRSTQQTSSGDLYAKYCIAEDQIFIGSISGDDVLLDMLQDSLGDSTQSGLFQIFLGLGRQRADVSIGFELMPREIKPPRIIHKQNDDTRYFILTLISDAIVLDEFLRPMLWLPASWLARLIDVDEDELALVRHYSASRRTAGWNSAACLPKSADLALRAGSCFLYSYNGSEDDDGLSDKLSTIVSDRIGVRKAEGFGEMSFSSQYFEWMLKNQGELE